MAGRKKFWLSNAPKFAVQGVAFCPNKGDVISLDTGDNIRVWTLANGAEILPVPRGCKAERAEVSVQFRWLGDDHISYPDGNLVQIMNLKSGKLVRTFKGHKGPTLCHACNPDKGLFVSGAQDGSLRVWDLQTASCLDVIEDLAWVLAAALSQDGTQVAVGCADKSVSLWG
jgi:WD40 repeat protein